MTSAPQDPFRGVGQVAVMLHEFYVELAQPGRFTEVQALYLTGKYVEGIARNGGA